VLLSSSDADTYTTFVKKHHGHAVSVSFNSKDTATSARQLFSCTLEKPYASYDEKDTGYLLRLDTIEPASYPSFQQVKDTIENDYIAQKARLSFDNEMVRLTRHAQAGSLEQVAKEEGLTLYTISPYSNTDTERIKTLKEKGIDALDLLKLEQIGAVTLSTKPDKTYIIQLNSIIKGQDNEQEATDADITKHPQYAQMVQQDRSLLLQGYIASLYRCAKIETNDIIEVLEENNTI
jgi:hypothetical protein